MNIEPEVPLVERLRKLLPPADQEWSEFDYLIQEAAKALQTEEKRWTQVAWLGYAKDGKQHLLWHTPDSAEEERAWLDKHYAKCVPLFSPEQPTPQIQREGDKNVG